jgi:hypothetical protein
MNKLSNLRLPNSDASMHQINQIAQTLNDITRLMVDRPEDVMVRIQGTEPNSVLKLAVHTYGRRQGRRQRG